jgi:proteasome lid subunit RPN8/RPN11
MDFEPMPDGIARTLVREAHAAAPNEMCGFIIARWNHIPIRNCHPDPERHFSMDEEAMLDVLTSDQKVLGVYHSHPRGTKDGMAYAILAPATTL